MKHGTICLNFVLALSLFSLAAHADRVIVTPTGTTLAPKQVAFEYMYGLDHHTRQASFASVGVNTFELEFTRLQFPGNDHYVLSVQDELLPETFYTPAVAVGVRDILGSARHSDPFGYAGRSLYVTVNKMLIGTQSASFPFRNASFSAGIGTGVPRALFGSLSSQLGLGLSQAIEFDGKGLNYRVDHAIGNVARIEYVRLHGANFIGAEFKSPTKF